MICCGGESTVIDLSIFFIGMGSNDYLNNYLMPNYATRNQYNPEQFAELLVQLYSQQLINLYNLGARRFVLSGVGSLGYTPNAIAMSPDGRCSEEAEALALSFNSKVASMVDTLTSRLSRSRFIFIDFYTMNMLRLLFSAGHPTIQKKVLPAASLVRSWRLNPLNDLQRSWRLHPLLVTCRLTSKAIPCLGDVLLDS